MLYLQISTKTYLFISFYFIMILKGGITMKYVEYSFRHAKAIIESDLFFKKHYDELIQVISNISDEQLQNNFELKKQQHADKGTAFKSLTPSINELLKENLCNISGWEKEVEIFNDENNQLGNTEWRLDFAYKNAFAVEVAFNHGEAITWNLIKPVLASELNHVKKAVQTQIGIYICATNELKEFGNIDSASGSYEKVLRYLPPLRNQLTIPMMIIGLRAPRSFFISKDTKNIKSCNNQISAKQLLNLVERNLLSQNIPFEKSYTVEKVSNNNIEKQKFKLFCEPKQLCVFDTIQSKSILNAYLKTHKLIDISNHSISYEDAIKIFDYLNQ